MNLTKTIVFIFRAKGKGYGEAYLRIVEDPGWIKLDDYLSCFMGVAETAAADWWLWQASRIKDGV